MSLPPTDEQLHGNFDLDPALEYSTLSSQVALLKGPTSIPSPKTRSQKAAAAGIAGGDTAKEPGHSSSPPPSAPTPSKPQHIKPYQRLPRTKPTPKRDNQLKELTSAMSSIDTDEGAPIPHEDALTTHEIDEMSARSSRIEDAIEDHQTQLQTSRVRIAALESENSILLGKINKLLNDVAGIKETLAMGGTEGKPSGASKSRIVGGKAGTQAHAGAPESRAPGSGSATIIRAPEVQQQDANLGGRPVPKRKFIG